MIKKDTTNLTGMDYRLISLALIFSIKTIAYSQIGYVGSIEQADSVYSIFNDNENLIKLPLFNSDTLLVISKKGNRPRHIVLISNEIMDTLEAWMSERISKEKGFTIYKKMGRLRFVSHEIESPEIHSFYGFEKGRWSYYDYTLNRKKQGLRINYRNKAKDKSLTSIENYVNDTLDGWSYLKVAGKHEEIHNYKMGKYHGQQKYLLKGKLMSVAEWNHDHLVHGYHYNKKGEITKEFFGDESGITKVLEFKKGEIVSKRMYSNKGSDFYIGK